MTVSDWVLIATTLFLGAIAIWGNRIRQAIYRPKISVTFQEIAPYCHKTFYRNPQLPDLNEPVYFFRFKLENTGSYPLKNCEAKLDQLYIFDSAGKPQKLSGWNDITLVWASGRRPVIDLLPHRKDFCNLGHVASRQYQKEHESKLFINLPGTHAQPLRFLFELAGFPYSQANCLVPGRYAIKVIVYAENAEPQDLWFEIAWSGKWQNAEAEMFRELVINRISKLE